jgi:hypothetical protein
MRQFTAALALLAVAQFAQAKTFKTQFIRFELPPNWSCNQEEGTDWVCQPDNLAEKSEAIVVVVTKERDDIDDNLEKYKQVLGTARDMRDLTGAAYKSEVTYVREKSLRGQVWADSLHFGSEMPEFYTRYVASTKEKIAGLITYSIAKSANAKYADMLDKMIDTLEMTYDPKAFEEAIKKGSLIGSRSRLVGGRTLPTVTSTTAKPQDKPDEDLNMKIGVVVLLVAAVGYFIYKKKKG